MTMVTPKRLLLSALWLSLLIYAFGFAPQEKVPSVDDIMAIMTMESDLDPLIVAVFNLLGVWPMIMGALLLIDARDQTIPAWPFVFGSFVLGNFILFPYLILRQDNPTHQPGTSLLLKVADSNILAGLIFIASAYLIYLGLFTGNLDAFMAEFRINNLVNIMSVDFLLFLVAFPSVLADDMRRRGMHVNYRFWLYSAVPVLGPSVYLLTRGRLIETGRVS